MSDDTVGRIAPDHPEFTCEKCGGRNVVWFVASDLWNRVARRPDGTDPMLCPICFVLMAEEKGVNPTAWEIVQEGMSAAPCPHAVKPTRAWYCHRGHISFPTNPPPDPLICGAECDAPIMALVER